jgi:hypothetical protein
MQLRSIPTLLLIGAILALVGPISAHGPELDYQDGRVVVFTPYALIDGTPVYEDEFAFSFTNLGFQSLPLAAGGGHLTVGSTIGLTVHDLATNLKLSSPQYLFFHNGQSFADPGSAVLRILGRNQSITKGGASFSDLPIGEVAGPDDFHDHLGVLLQNGAVGLYGLLVANTSTDPSVADSLPYYMVINNDLGPAAYAKALADLNATAVPESSTLRLLSLAIVGVAGAGLIRGVGRSATPPQS